MRGDSQLGHADGAVGPCVIPDPVGNAKYMYEVSLRADPNYSCRVTVWHLKQGIIANNVSAVIIRMLKDYENL